MFKKLLFKALKSLTPEEKAMVREFLEDGDVSGDENAVDTVTDEENSDTIENKNEEGEKEMAENVDEKVEKSVETEKETDKAENNEVEKEVSTEKVEEKEKVADEQPNAEDAPAEPTQNTAVVQDGEPMGNGIRVDDLVTKDELCERLAALEAKYDAVIKENQDLKDKYENKDFGGFQRQGVMQKDKSANSSFDEYSKQFM